jgi:hypothetical protein
MEQVTICYNKKQMEMGIAQKYPKPTQWIDG